MPLLKKYCLYTCIIYALFSVSYAQPPEALEKVDSIVNRHMAENHIPGLALAILGKGKIIKKGFYGSSNMEAGTMVDAHTVFEIASMSKQITCAAILLLQEDGLLSVHDKLSGYLTGLPASWENMTIEQLMNHTSGLRDDWDEPTSYFLANHSAEKMKNAQLQHPLLFEPGQGFQYSSGPFFLELVIEKITGKHYSFFLKERIFDKLNMYNTAVYDTVLVPQGMAKGYRWEKGIYEHGTGLPAAAKARADVGIITTLDDMIKWSLALNEGSLLNSKSSKIMFTPGKLKSGKSIPYGYGWYIYFFRNQLIYEHAGAFRTGFNSRITRIPGAEIEIIILSNKWQANLADLTNELASLYHPHFRRISEITLTNAGPKKRDAEIRELIYNLSIKRFNTGQLYQQVNISGFDPDELKELLKGFREIACIGAKNYSSKPIILFGSAITELLYYKIWADQTTYWSFGFNEKGELVFAGPED